MDIVLIVAAVWIALDVAFVGLISVLSARGAMVRRPSAVLSLPRIGETSVPATDR